MDRSTICELKTVSINFIHIGSFMKKNFTVWFLLCCLLMTSVSIAQKKRSADPLSEKAEKMLLQSKYQHYVPPKAESPQGIKESWDRKYRELQTTKVRTTTVHANVMPSWSHSTGYANAIVGQPIEVWGNVWGGNGVYVYKWDFGDGSTDSGSVGNPRNIAVMHTYATANPWNATLKVWDQTGAMDQDVVTIRAFAAPTHQIQVNMAIEKGLKYLYLNQASNGYWDRNMGSCILAFEENGHKGNNFDDDIYAETVSNGLQYLLSMAYEVAISPQTYGNPDSDGDGKGVVLVNSGYEQGLDLLGLIGGGSKVWAESTLVAGGPLAGQSVYKVVRNAIDQIAYAQTEGYGRGGWRYTVSGSDAGSDNSAVAWITLGLEAAQNLWGIPIPAFVKDELLIWLKYSQGSDGGFGYTDPNFWNNLVKTASGIGSYALLGKTSADSNVAAALTFINNHWNDGYDNSSAAEHFTGNIYVMWGMAKALRTSNGRAGISHIGVHDWYDEYSHHLLENPSWKQYADGSWPDGYWVGTGSLSTAFAILVLTQSVGISLPVAVIEPAGPFPVGLGFKMNGERSFHQDPNHQIVAYDWDWDASNGLGWDTGRIDATGKKPFNPGYNTAGVYRVTLRVKDDSSPPLLNTKSIDVIISDTVPHPPIAVAGPATGYNARVGVPILLDGRRSYSPDSARGVTIVRYSWDLDGNGVYGDAERDTVTVVFGTVKSVLVSLRVYNSRGDTSSNLAEVRVTAAQNDILTDFFEVKPQIVWRGDQIGLLATATVKPSSDVGTFSNVLVRFYLGDPFTIGTKIGSDHFIDLAKSRVDTIRDIGTIPTDAKYGFFDVFVYIDANELIGEFDEVNNLRSARIEVKPPKPNVHASRNCLNFATVEMGASLSLRVLVYNDSTAESPFRVDSAFTDNPAFQIGEYTKIIMPGEVGFADVIFTPLQPGLAEGFAHFFTNDPNGVVTMLGLEGFGDLHATGTGQTIYSGLATFNYLPAPPYSVVEAYRVVKDGDSVQFHFVRSTLVVPENSGVNYALSLLEGQAGLKDSDFVVFRLKLPDCEGPFPERYCEPQRGARFFAEFPAKHIFNQDIWAVSPRAIARRLYPGYNSVSWNVQPRDVSVHSVFEGLMRTDKVQIILDYKNDGEGNPEFIWYIPALGKYNPLQMTNFRKGYFVRLYKNADPDSFFVFGIPVCAKTELKLYEGYNFISYLPEFPDSVAHALGNIISDTNFVAAFNYKNDGQAEWFDMYPMGDFQAMREGNGYFVRWKHGTRLFNYQMTIPFLPIAPELKASAPRATERLSIAQTNLPLVMFVYGTSIKQGDKLVAKGSVLRAIDSDGIVCGEGKFVDDGVVSMSIRADDPSTPIDEGARIGESVRLTLNNVMMGQSAVWTEFGDVQELKLFTPTRVAESGSAPKEFALYQNFPNPFNPATEIRYDLALSVPVRLTIFNSLGQEVRTLVNEQQSAGTYSIVWDGRNNSGTLVSSGIYIYKISAGSFVRSNKMTVLK